MAKRFIESGTFRNEFIRSLPAEYKLFYLYLLCECDHCGIWSVEMDVASLRIGANVIRSEALKHFKNKIVEFDNGTKWFIPAFIFFQYGDVSNAANKIHKSVCNRLEKNNLFQFVLNANSVDDFDNSKGFDTLTEEFPKGYQRVTEDYPNTSERVAKEYPQSSVTLKVKDKDKVKVKEKIKEKENKKEKENAERISFDLRGGNESGDISTPPEVRTLAISSEAKKYNEHTAIIEAYSDWTKERGLPVRIDAADGAAVKKIVAFLSKFETVTSGQKTILDLFKFVLSSWNSLTPWLQTQTQLKQINSQLPTIIETIKTKQNGKASSQNQQQQQLANLATALRNSIEGSEGM